MRPLLQTDVGVLSNYPSLGYDDAIETTVTKVTADPTVDCGTS